MMKSVLSAECWSRRGRKQGDGELGVFRSHHASVILRAGFLRSPYPHAAC